MLKAKYFIAPALALVAVAAWNIHQRRSLETAERETAEVERSIGERRPGGRSASGGARISPVERPLAVGKDGPLDWRAISQRLANAGEGLEAGDLGAIASLQARLATMSDAELVAAIEEVESLGLDEDVLETLQEMLIEPLIEKNPELALNTFADRISDDPDGIGWQLSFALTEWAENDVAAAQAWLDRQIAAGVFESKSLDGRSEARLEFEAALLGALLEADPAAAERRLAALAEDERRETLEQVSFTDLDPAGQRAYAALVRGLVPEDERAGSFAYLVEDIVPDGGFQAVDSFFKLVGASAEERAVSARQAVRTQIEQIADERPVTGADIEEMRTWLANHDPDSIDRMTGRAIADATQDCSEFPFEAADRLAREYFRKTGNEQVIVAFLESFAARSNLEQALPLAQLISDAARREKILERLR